MFKLLTDEEKDKLKAEYKLRRLVLIVSFLAAIFLIGVVGLFPTYIITASREKDAQNRVEALNKELTGNSSEDIDKWLQDINTKIKLFTPAADNDRPYEAYLKIISLKPEKIIIEGMGYQKTKANLVEYSVRGIAKDRRSLIDFQNKLNSSADFKNASVPVSDLAKDSDIAFTLSLDPKK